MSTNAALMKICNKESKSLHTTVLRDQIRHHHVIARKISTVITLRKKHLKGRLTSLRYGRIKKNTSRRQKQKTMEIGLLYPSSSQSRRKDYFREQGGTKKNIVQPRNARDWECFREWIESSKYQIFTQNFYNMADFKTRCLKTGRFLSQKFYVSGLEVGNFLRNQFWTKLG